ncbi:porin [Chitinophaga lutea]
MRITRIVWLTGCLLFMTVAARAQFLMDMIDTTTELGKGMISMYRKYDQLRISGYMQPQFQYASGKGIQSYSGGDFAGNSDNRFMLRRGRVRFDYAHYNKRDLPTVQFVFQFDGTERGVNIRDFWGRVFDGQWDVAALTMGMFARPFGYEVNLSSGDREAPERGRMSQILMRSERDMGGMLTFEPRSKQHPLHFLKIDVGLFNGQGLSGPADFDSHKDLIARVAMKPVPINAAGWKLSAGASVLYGGMEQFTKEIYTMDAGKPSFNVDSADSNKGQIAPRHYYGADAQLVIPNRKGATQFRAEYIRGTQTSTHFETETPGIIPLAIGGGFAPLYIRKFDGAYLSFLQHLGSPKHQLVLKYDWYDPNKDVKGRQIADPSQTHLSLADIRYDTFGFGYVYYFNEFMKATFWYDRVWNESTGLEHFEQDIDDNVFTARLQFRF